MQRSVLTLGGKLLEPHDFQVQVEGNAGAGADSNSLYDSPPPGSGFRKGVSDSIENSMLRALNDVKSFLECCIFARKFIKGLCSRSVAIEMHVRYRI